MRAKAIYRGMETVHGPATGLVYFIRARSASLDCVKIGFTRNNPEQRLRALQTGCPLDLVLVGSVIGCERMEAELHKVFGNDHARGEWFTLTRHVEANIEAIMTAQNWAWMR